MKKLLVSVLLICLLTVPALAVDFLDFQYTNENGVKVVDVDAYLAAVAEEKVLAAGLDLDVDIFWIINEKGELEFDNDLFELAYAAALAELEEPQQTQQEEVVVDDPAEDPVDTSFADDASNYPLGSYIDEAGNVFSADGDLLSSGTTLALEPDTGSSDLDSVSDAEAVAVVADEDSVPAVYAISDMRSGDSDSGDIVSGLKALIISIFGEYTPVMTTMAVTETVDNVTTTTLIDAVAAGAAGVDYEWLSGVFLFGILLFCLMKLLGGILK